MTDYEMLRNALNIARKAHAGQVDKAGEDYIFHPVTVALQCETIDEKCAALLHDVVEDTSVTLEDLKEAGFNDNIIDAVRLLTHVRDVNDPDDYMHYIQRLKAGKNATAVRVKLADLTNNTDISRLQGRHPYKYDTYLKAIAYLKQDEKSDALNPAKTSQG